MTDRIFIDTNILVYSSIDDGKSNKHDIAVDLLKHIQTNENTVHISTQVVLECYKALLRYNIPDADIRKLIDSILLKVETNIINISTIKQSWKLRDRYKLSYWDSLIVSSALEYDCRILYSEDMHHNQLIEDNLKIVNPFA
jgi:predicted nucleic acid-binding protein